MPYIKNYREEVPEYRRPVLIQGPFGAAEDCGELNFVITTACIYYLRKKGRKYQTYNDIVGALECAKMELNRRSIAPYEDTKIEENGDVYPEELL